MTNFRFSTSIEVRYGDLDAQGHLNNAKYFTFMEQARIKYMTAVGLWDSSRRFDEIGIIIAEAACTYKKPVQLGQVVTVFVRVSQFGTKSFEMEYALQVGETEVALGRTAQVAYDYHQAHSIVIPDEWRLKITNFESS